MNYQNKYLKYKTKYIELKNKIQEGSAFKKIKDCYKPIDDNNSVLLETKIKFDRCIEEQTRTGKDNEYFLIFNFYQNENHKLSPSLCYTLNNILFNMDIKPEKIFLLTQYFNKQLFDKISYDDFKIQPLTEKLIFDSEWQNKCEYLLELFKTNKLNHIMNDDINKNDSNYKKIMSNKINEIINLLNNSIIKNKINDIKINIIIITHGYENVVNETLPLITIDGSREDINAISINEFYVYLTDLFRNTLVSKIVFLPAFCYNSIFRKFMLQKIRDDTNIFNKKIYIFTVEPSLRIYYLMLRIVDFSFSLTFDEFINKLKSQYGDKINFNQYFIDAIDDGLEQINISDEENDLINEFIASNPEPNLFYPKTTNVSQLLPNSTYQKILEAGSLDVVTKIYTEYFNEFEINSENSKRNFKEKMFDAYLIKNLPFFKQAFENVSFFESGNFKKYVIDNRKAFVKVIEK